MNCSNSGSARLLLTRGALTFDDLKAALMKEFGRTISRQEVYQSLKNRTKKTTESVRRYVMEMESISYRYRIRIGCFRSRRIEQPHKWLFVIQHRTNDSRIESRS